VQWHQVFSFNRVDNNVDRSLIVHREVEDENDVST
jgi:hypothetical protein